MGWYAVYSREMLLLRKKIGKMGYIFSTVISPFIYLLSFGMGLGGRVTVSGGGYLPFLASGIVSMPVIMNAFSQTPPRSTLFPSAALFRSWKKRMNCAPR